MQKTPNKSLFSFIHGIIRFDLIIALLSIFDIILHSIYDVLNLFDYLINIFFNRLISKQTFIICIIVHQFSFFVIQFFQEIFFIAKPSTNFLCSMFSSIHNLILYFMQPIPKASLFSFIHGIIRFDLIIASLNILNLILHSIYDVLNLFDYLINIFLTRLISMQAFIIMVSQNSVFIIQTIFGTCLVSN